MSLPADPHEPAYDDVRLDNLVLSALGERVNPEFEAHLMSCAECRDELDALASTALLARELEAEAADWSADSDRPADAGSPDRARADSIWAGITAELQLDQQSDARPSRQPAKPPPAIRSSDLPGDELRARRTAPLDRPSRRGSTWLVAAVVVGVVAGGVGYAAGRHSSSPSAAIASTAALSAMPGGPVQVSGSAEIRSDAAGTELSVTAKGLPQREGYYEVWLFNPAVNQMVAVGTLPSDGTGTFPVPPGLDPARYHVVDVSAQDYNGDPTHQQSVLRGQLSP